MKNRKYENHYPPNGPGNTSRVQPVDASPERKKTIDWPRYRILRRFFLRLLGQLLLWDVLFNLPVMRWFRPDPLPRWQKAARRYSELATRMGGILIKLGQFLSTRVDILPSEITAELSGLQDKVPPEPVADIKRVIEDDFNCPVDDIFPYFSSIAVGAASLAQAHLATLPGGESVAVKVLRPKIHIFVQTDLDALRFVCRWLKRFRKIRDRVDLDHLINEFSKTTLEELDMVREKENILRFEKDIVDFEDVIAPDVYESFCSARVLTLENVAYIRITDTDTARSCGVDLSQVADRLYDIYMHQIFVTNFVHVDPHPGNLFVKPLPLPDEAAYKTGGFKPGEAVPHAENRPFQLVFIDFGMTALVSERLKAAMRAGAMGLGTQDAQRIVQAYVMAGSLRPGADLRRLEQAHQEWLQKIWGLRLGALNETARRELAFFMHEYRDLIRETPFQFQADMLFIARAIGILSGLATAIDPDFDPWSKAMVYAKRFAREELTEDWQGFWEELFMLGKQAWRIPSHLDQVLTRTKQGALTIQVTLSPEMRRAIHRIDLSVKRFAWMVITAGLLVAAVNLHIAGKDTPYSVSLFALSVVAFLWGMRKG
jgi:predicted unusual protein kinase regulating ubiquinone biosynthesis (AarF/ABC1/UbiB family)